MQTKQYFFLLFLLLSFESVSSTVQFENLDYPDLEIEVWEISNEGTNRTNILLSNESFTLNGSNDYILIFQPTDPNLFENPGKFFRIFMIMLALAFTLLVLIMIPIGLTIIIKKGLGK